MPLFKHADSWESWFNPVAWNAAEGNSSEGSNPSLSTTSTKTYQNRQTTPIYQEKTSCLYLSFFNYYRMVTL